MLKETKKLWQWFWHRTEGAVAVEFAILLPVLIAVLFGIIDFGDLFMKEHLITNASREGARYGVAYRVDTSNNRILPSGQTTQIKSVVNNYLTGLLPTGSWTVPNPTYDTSTRKLTVTVNATKSWYGPLGLVLANPFSFSASTAMIAE
jgi:Flp pilus assembly protein TadG